MKKILLIIFVVSFATSIFAQDDYQLALQYYKNEEFEKASVLFEKLYKKRGTKFYFDYYLNCLIELEDFDLAEKKIKKQIKKHKSDLTFNVDLGFIYKKQGFEDKAEKEFKHVLKNLISDKNQIIRVANSFTNKKEYDWAEKVYYEGRRISSEKFHLELANLFSIQRKSAEMIDQFLNLISSNYGQTGMVKKRFLWFLNHDTNDEFFNLLKSKLLAKIQLTRNDLFNEMLIWLFTQKNDFYNAYIQAKALDRRNNEIGVRVFTIAELAFENNDYSTANEAFTYVVNKGKSKPYYYKANFGLLDVLYLQVTNNEINTEPELKKVEERYLSLVNELGINSKTIVLIVDLAHLQAFYLNNTDDAIDLLNEAIELQGINNKSKGVCQIELGDILLLEDNSWDAILTYAKAEEINKHNDVGDEAKLKKAKVYYFIGNFTWAQSQLDILKGSTSKLIANDAFELANIIKDNLGEDSVYTALETYASADLLFFQHKFEEANTLIDTLLKNYSFHSIADEAYFLKYKIALSNTNYEEAVANLQIIVKNYPWDILADKSVFYTAELYDYKLNDKEKAIEYYKMLLFDYTGSIYVVRARERFRTLNGDFDEEN